MRLGSSSPTVDFNGTKYTSLEGSAADNNISIDNVLGRGKFNPLSQPGIALTTQQAKELGVKVGDKVSVRDNKTGKVVTATFYDSAGSRRPGAEKLGHMEVSPALADQLGINYRNRSGKVVDAVTNSESLAGRYSIERFSGSQQGTGFTPAPASTASNPTADAIASSFDNHYTRGPSMESVMSGKAELKIGDSGAAVKALQQKLGVEPDGKFGPITLRALMAAQKQAGLTGTPGHAGKTTFEHIANAGDTFTSAKPPTTAAVDERSSTTGGQNLTARFTGTEKVGQRSQMKTGQITVNGHTYQFNSGGWGRGNLPAGSYTVSGGQRTSEKGMVRDGVGFKFQLSDKYDPRVKGDARSGLLIHPDGGVRGTMGCIGIVGDAAKLKTFYADMQAELKRHNGSFKLQVE